MVGRVGERAQVRAALNAARGGRGRLVLLSGPAGIGKTRLAQAAVHDAEQGGMQVARGYALDDVGAPALWPWLRLMRAWPDTGSLPTARGSQSEAGARFRLFTAITTLVCARADSAGGLLVVLEDMHWADHLSALLLRHVAAELEDHPIVMVVTHREPLSGPLVGVLPDLLRSAAQQVTLTGLRVADVETWLPQITGHPDGGPALAVAVHTLTGGNPLHVRLIAEDLTTQGGVPTPGALEHLMVDRPELRRLITAKVDALHPDTRALLDAASVLGERIDPSALEAMTGHPPARLRALLAEAVTGGVLREATDGVRFEHALVRDAVYATLPSGRRHDLHRGAALALAATSSLAGPITTHWQRADGPDARAQAQGWAETADEQARAALAHDDAARFAGIAVRSARDRTVDGSELARVLIRHAEAALLANQVEACTQSCAEAADLAETAGRVDLLAQAGLVIHGVGDPPVQQLASRICTRALAGLDPGDHTTRARLLAQLAVGAAESGDGPTAVTLSAEALTEAEHSGDPDAMLEAIAARHLTISVPDMVTERLALGSQAIELNSTDRYPIAALWGHLWRADAALQLGNLAELDRQLTDIDSVAQRRGSALAQWHHHRFSASRQAMVGEFTAARDANDAARQLGHRADDISLTALSDAFSIQLSILRGDPTDMPTGWEETLSHAPRMPLVQLIHPIHHALTGDLDRARAEFAEFRHLPETYPYGLRWAGTMGMVALAAVLLDDTDVAATTYTQLRDTAHYYSGDGSGAVFSHGANCRIVGELAQITGRHEDALTHFADAVAMNTRVGARPFTALSRLGWAQTLTTLEISCDPHGGPTAAELLTHAAAEFHRLDMPGPLATANTALDALHHASTTPTPLTVRESEIAHLVGHALTNREIAGRLHLSERTVESHIRSILAKLGFHTRTQIATWVLQDH